MWWIALALVCGFVGVYIALRLYINAILVKDAKFNTILDKLQRETEAIITEFNRITDRNVTVAEESARKLKHLIQQGRDCLTRLSKRTPHVDSDGASGIESDIASGTEPGIASGIAPDAAPVTDIDIAADPAVSAPGKPVRVYSPRDVAHASDHSRRAQQHAEAVTNDTRAQIMRLLQNGVGVEDIAARVGISVSEVETISVLLDV